MDTRIEQLLENIDNQYTSVVVTAKRARQIIEYQTTLGAGLEEKPMPPLLEGSTHGMKPLTIAFQEVVEQKIGWERPLEAEDAVK